LILPMKKVSLVVLNKHREESLKKLRSLGVLHLGNHPVTSENLTKLLESKAQAETALGILRPYIDPKKQGKAGPQINSTEGFKEPEIVNQILGLAERRKTIKEKIAQLGRERSRIEEWGNFNPQDIGFLAEKANLAIFLYKISRKNITDLPKETRYVVLKGDKSYVYILVLDKELPGRTPFALSTSSLKEIDSQCAEVENQLAEIEKQLLTMADGKELIDNELKTLQVNIEFETAQAKMGVLEDVPQESAVAWISGFIPQEDLGVLKRGAAENGWAMVTDDPGPNDNVPTKLRNNPVASLLYTVTDFLQIVPGYHEADITGWFLLFFTIFFGMIYGDAGYGSIFVILAIIFILKSLKKGVHPGLKLLLLLGCSTVIWGALTCSWFGVEPQYLPKVLRDLSLPLISVGRGESAHGAAYDAAIVQQNLMIFCFSLALLHLSIGHMVAISHCKNLKILAELGSIMMLAGMYGVMLSVIVSNEYRKIPLFEPCVYGLFIGFILNFVFANYNGSIGKSILDGLKNIVPMLLGIANVFGDIMSYIRLWAVGMAGGAISSTVDSMAGPMLGRFTVFIFGVLILVTGHGLNFVLNALSVLVHGVRLNTLEFSGHVGLTWAGTAYKPFKERN